MYIFAMNPLVDTAKWAVRRGSVYFFMNLVCARDSDCLCSRESRKCRGPMLCYAVARFVLCCIGGSGACDLLRKMAIQKDRLENEEQ